MAKGSLTIEVTDARGGAVSGEQHIELDPQPRSIGGDPMEVTFNVRGHKSFEISNISCHDGPGTLYTFRLTVDGYKPYAFFQLMKTGRNVPSEARVRVVAAGRRAVPVGAPARDLEGELLLARLGLDAPERAEPALQWGSGELPNFKAKHSR